MPQEHDALDYTGVLDGHAPTKPGYIEPEFDRDLSGKLREAFRKADDAKSAYSNDWEFFQAYLKGDQLIARHRDSGEILRLSVEDSRKLRSVNNVCRPSSRSLVGKLSKITPTCTVIPATSDFEEQWGAKVADKVIAYLRRKENLDVKYVEANEYLPWAGNAFLRIEWDRDAGKDIVFCEVCNYFNYETELEGDPCPQCSMQREQEMQRHQIETAQFGAEQAQLEAMSAEVGEELPPEITQQEPPAPPQLGPLKPDEEIPVLIGANEGDIKISVTDPRDIYVENGATCLQDATWICIRTAEPIQNLRGEFPNFSHIIEEEDQIKSERRKDLSSWEAYGSEEEIEDYAYRYEFHEKPTNAYPMGRLIVMINDLVVDERENPYFSCFGRYPLFHFGFDRNAGEFWYEPPMAQAWHLQRELNAVETQKREYIELVLRPKLMNPIGSRVTADEFTAVTAQVVTYNPSVPMPQFVSPPGLPNDLWGRANELAANIRQLFGITEQEAGLTPSDPNGRAMAIIEAEADQQIGPILTRNHEEWRQLHRAMLCLVQEYYHDERKVTVAGPDGAQTYCFDELNLEPGWDVQIEQEDGLSRNPAVRLTQALDLLNAGVFTDPTTGMLDNKSFMRKAGLKLPNEGYDIESTERARASEIPYKIAQGIPHIPEMIDVPGIFADELEGWLRGPGRRADSMHRQQVMEVWGFYKGWSLAPDMMPQGMGQPMGGQGGAGSAGPDGSAPGGTANNPGHLGTDLAGGGGNISQQAGQQVNQADRSAEGQARVQMNREG